MSKKKSNPDQNFRAPKVGIIALFGLVFSLLLSLIGFVSPTFLINWPIMLVSPLVGVFVGKIIYEKGDIFNKVIFPLLSPLKRELKVKNAPGHTLLSVADFFFSPTTIENVFKPIVADWRKEFFDALQEGRRWKAQWIRVRYVLSFVMAMGLSKVLSLIRSVAHR